MAFEAKCIFCGSSTIFLCEVCLKAGIFVIGVPRRIFKVFCLVGVVRAIGRFRCKSIVGGVRGGGMGYGI